MQGKHPLQCAITLTSQRTVTSNVFLTLLMWLSDEIWVLMFRVYQDKSDVALLSLISQCYYQIASNNFS